MKTELPDSPWRTAESALLRLPGTMRSGSGDRRDGVRKTIKCRYLESMAHIFVAVIVHLNTPYIQKCSVLQQKLFILLISFMM